MKTEMKSSDLKRPRCCCLVLLAWLFIFELPNYSLATERYLDGGPLVVPGESTDLFTLRTPDNISGEANIETWDEKRVEVTYQIYAKGRSKGEVERFTDMVRITLDRDDKEVKLRVQTPSRAPWRGDDRTVRVTLEAHLPKGIEVQSRTAYFNLDLEGPLGEVTVDNDYGSVALREAKGEISIRTSYDKIELEKIEGELRAESSYGSVHILDVDAKGKQILLESCYATITLEEVRGAASVSTCYGKIRASDIDAGNSPLCFETSYGKIELDNVRGQISAKTSYNPIIASDIVLTGGTNRLETVYSKISADFAQIEDSRLTICNRYSDIEISLPTNTSTKMVATVDSGGSIHASNFPITPTLLDRTRLEGIAGDGESIIEMNIDGIGTIEITGK